MLGNFLRGRNTPDEGTLSSKRGSPQVARGSQGGWGTLKSRFPEDLALLADELTE